ncbi:ribosome recycling factor [Spiroplasma turonicum]|uniref:Ribosome-recycling factor n=1 Tax=Spiroplasma turonicum TaxID=216946 RepID=A0A0K1P762_9MOLU|nr:ribosome recycling factor [Spiroplasma turonicum]AKU80125.1 ribosome recycling factor [Spiroplasma turonicum]ALX71125.1 ribosome recycling factor [Spiroplasma turonicum]
MIKELLDITNLEMLEVVESFKTYISKIRTGRANASILSSVMVDFYGTLTPINQTSQISAPEPQQLVVKPYDRGQVQNVVAGINKADLGLNPLAEADLIRINIPPLTEEIRKDLVKKMMKELENFKVRIRNLRRDAIDKVKKDSSLPEDLKSDFENQIQKLTDKNISLLDEVSKSKENDLMKV